MRPEERNGKPKTFTAAELMAEDLPEVPWVVPDVLPEGVTFLAGKPKLGKSSMARRYSYAGAVQAPRYKKADPEPEGDSADNRCQVRRHARDALADCQRRAGKEPRSWCLPPPHQPTEQR